MAPKVKETVETQEVTGNEAAKEMTPNKTVTQNDFAQSSMLDAIALNNELNSMNSGELRFTVVKTGEYRFNKTDKENNPIFNTETGAIEEIVSPYVEISGEGLSAKISTKRLDKSVIETLVSGQSYFGKYMLSADDNLNLQVQFTDVVPFNQELQARMKHNNIGQ